MLANIFAALLSISSVQAGTLVVAVNGGNPVPVDWEYRSVTSRSWVPGCTWWDFLQGSGFFPATYYTTYMPVQEGNTYTFQTMRGFWQTLCGAQMDEYNSLRFEFATMVGNTTYSGQFRVIPGGDSGEASTSCWIDESKDVYNQIQCDNPTVQWENSGTTQINVSMKDS